MPGRAAMRYADRHKGKWRARKVVPPDLIAYLPAPYTGRKWFLYETGVPVKGGDANAAQRIIDRYLEKVAEPAIEYARQAHRGGEDAATLRIEHPAIGSEGFLERSIFAARMVGANHLHVSSPRQRRETGPVHTEAVIDLWVDERKAKNDPPKERAISNKRTKIKAMLEFTAKPNVGVVTEDDLKEYRRKLLKNGTARDHLIDIKAMFAVAKRGGLIKVDPAQDLTYPGKSGNKRPPFSDAEAKAILEAARTAEPVVKWSHWIAAFSTAINSEILNADASEFYQTETGQWVFDMRARKLKTGFRPRIVPLHSSIIAEGFPAYLATRTGKPLFDGSAKSNDLKLNDFIHAIEIDGKPIHKTFYSWRHRVVHRLDKLTSPSLSRFIAGHAAKDIHEKFYLHHELPEEFGEIVAAIERLPDPTA